MSRSYTVQENESLATIAQKIYGNRLAWRRIYEANKHTIGSDPTVLKAGTNLIIPSNDSESLATTGARKIEVHRPSPNEQESEVLALKIQSTIISDKYNGNDQKISDSTPLEQSDGERTTKKSGWLENIKNKFSNIDVWGKIGAGVLGYIIGLVDPFTIYTFGQEQPKLNVLDPVVQLERPSDIRSQYLTEMNALYQSIGSNLDDRLLVLINTVNESINENSNDEGQNGISNSFSSLQKNHEIQTRNLKNFLEEVIEAERYYTSPDLTVDGVPELPISESHKEEIQRIRDKLASIRQKLEDKTNTDFTNVFKDLRLVTFLTVENRSRLPNVVRGEGLFVVYDEQGSVLNLPLTLVSSGETVEVDSPITDDTNSEKSAVNIVDTTPKSHTLADSSAAVLQLESPIFDSQGDKIVLDVERAFDKEYSYIILIQDMHGNIWEARGKLSTLGVNQNLKLLRNKAEALIQEKNSRWPWAK